MRHIILALNTVVVVLARRAGYIGWRNRFLKRLQIRSQYTVHPAKPIWQRNLGDLRTAKKWSYREGESAVF
jgi:hypothetical protein